MRIFPGTLDKNAQCELLNQIEAALDVAPLFVPRMPRTGRAFSVRMSNMGSLGWVSDKERGYRYQTLHPETDAPWAPIPQSLLALWRELADYSYDPEACLINYYTSDAKMGLHQDRDEEDFDAPVLSVSLGDRARFRLGGQNRKDKTSSLDISSGDVLILEKQTRLAFHGIDRIYPSSSNLLDGRQHFPDGGRINLTLRRVTKP